MNKLTEFMTKRMMPVANKISANRFIAALNQGFTMLIPFILIGSLLVTFNTIKIDSYQAFLTSTGLSTILATIPRFTTDMLSIYLVFAIAYSLTERHGYKDYAKIVGILGIYAFLLVTPVLEGDKGLISIPLTYLGGRGLFVAIIIAFLVGEIFCAMVKHRLIIRMPEGVPPMIEHSFAAIIPGIAITILFITIAQIMAGTGFGNVHELVIAILQKPISVASNSWLTLIFLLTISNLLWFFGIHGFMVITPFLNTIFMQPTLENIAATAAGQVPPNLLTMGFLDLCGLQAAPWVVLAIMCLFFTKNKRFNMLGKIGGLPAVFGISEPFRFGFPTVLNFTLLIPYLLFPLLCMILTAVCLEIGIVPPPAGMQVGTGLPILITGFLQSGIPGVILHIVQVLLGIVLYLPFFKLYVKQEEEKLELENQAE